MVHPSDGKAWQALDRFDPEFARDPRSVRLGLSTDGFTPYSNNSTSYSCWRVFMMPYNQPPNRCMKEEVMFLALIVPGPKDPVTKINVFMEPTVAPTAEAVVEEEAEEAATEMDNGEETSGADASIEEADTQAAPRRAIRYSYC
jgi:hypothetical protein